MGRIAHLLLVLIFWLTVSAFPLVSQEKKKDTSANADNRSITSLKQASILFQRGKEAFKDGKFSLANIYFRDFMVLYPDLPENAEILYLQGEMLYAQQKYPQAAEKYIDFYRNSQSEKGETALYKAILLFNRMGNPQKAGELLQNMKNINPNSLILGMGVQNLEMNNFIQDVENQHKSDSSTDDLESKKVESGVSGAKSGDVVIFE